MASRVDWPAFIRELALSAREAIAEVLESRPRPVGGREIEKFASRLDEAAIERLVGDIKRRGVPCTLLCEDLGLVELCGGGPPYLVVDPLDGTTNAARGIPHASVSLAVSNSSRLDGVYAGVVVDVFSGELFEAERGRGALRDGRRIRVSEVHELERAVITADLSRREMEMDWLGKMASRASAIRHLGSASLELCYVASGIVDVHLDLRWMIRPFDIAAGLLIVREAGGEALVKGRVDPGVALVPDERLVLIAAANNELLNAVNDLIGGLDRLSPLP